MKLELEIESKIFSVDWEQHNDTITATIDGTSYELVIMSPNPNVYTLLLNNQVYELAIEPNPLTNTNQVKVASQVITTKIVDRRQRGHKIDKVASGTQPISAPMPGRIVQVLKNVGDEVKSGEGVIIVEAMKMQNELGSPKNGIVTAIKVKPGQNVVSGEVLAIIE
ncbi:MAG: biotin/lipoic acid binding domain-containing protein [bacterium]|nr:MAG: biotin/lipoic acid binding domain-containing protein [bacterium]